MMLVMLLARLVETSQRIASISKRRTKIELLSALLLQTHGEEIEIAAAFLSARTRQGKIGIGYGALRETFGAPAAGPQLDLADVDRAFAPFHSRPARPHRIAEASLLPRDGAEQHFSPRCCWASCVTARSKASCWTPSPRRRSCRWIACGTRPWWPATSSPSRGRSSNAAKPALADYDIRLFQPVQPMLAQTAEDVEEAIDDLGEAALEFKLDGARIQVHKSGDQVAIFSRALNDVTAAVPEIVEVVRALPGQDLILDGEVHQPQTRRPSAAIPGDRAALQPETRSGENADRVAADALLVRPAVPATAICCMSRSRADSRRCASIAAVIPHTVTADAARGARISDRSSGARPRRHHGEIAGVANTRPEHAAGAWLKVKHVKTLDLVILAAEWGSGRRKGWLSNLHLGARDTEKGGFAMLGKTFKGLTRRNARLADRRNS